MRKSLSLSTEFRQVVHGQLLHLKLTILCPHLLNILYKLLFNNYLYVKNPWITCSGRWQKLGPFVFKLRCLSYPPIHSLNNNYSLI